jgi:hypothetical protein
MQSEIQPAELSGLIEDCSFCADLRKLLEPLNCWLEERHERIDDTWSPFVWYKSLGAKPIGIDHLYYECRECHGTGKRLSARGHEVVAWLEKYGGNLLSALQPIEATKVLWGQV